MSALYKRSGGVSTSGTSGTTIAEIEAASGNHLVNFLVYCGHTNTTNNGHSLTFTYTDNTTLSRTPATAGQRHIWANDAALMEYSAGRFSFLGNLNTSKQVKKIRVATNGSATASKFGIISAMELPQSESLSMKRASGSSNSTTPMTLITSVTADPGKVLTRWSAFTAKTNDSDTHMLLRATFTDDTNSELDTGSGDGDFYLIANPAGILYLLANSYINHIFFPTDKSVKKLEVFTNDVGTGTRYAVLSAVQEENDSRRKIARGFSTTGSGDVMADISAGSDKWLEAVHVLAAQSTSPNSAIQGIATYSDSSTTSFTTTTNAGRTLLGNDGGFGMMPFASGSPFSEKDIQRVEILTNGVGSGSRVALVYAIEGPDIVAGSGSSDLLLSCTGSLVDASTTFRDPGEFSMGFGLTV